MNFSGSMTKTRKKENIDTLWVVTGISRLTGERERCSMAAPKDVAQLLMVSWAVKPARYRLYTRLKLEPYQTELLKK